MTPEERMLAAFNDFKDEKQQLLAQVSRFGNCASTLLEVDCTAADCREPLTSIV
jgi:hypothetical protein